MIRRRGLLGVSKGRLPSAYQEVEWIAKTDNQWINTGIIPNTYGGNWNFEITMKLDDLTQTNFFTGNANSNMYFTGSTRSEFRMYVGGSTRVSILIITPRDKVLSKFTLKAGLRYHGKSFLEYEGIQYADNKENEDTMSSKPLWILRAPSSAATGPMTLYHFKATDASDNLISELIPCYRKSDNEIGLYDLVTDTFLTNQGTGTFTKGADV